MNPNEHVSLDGGKFLAGFGAEEYSFTSGEAAASFLPITTYALWFALTAIGIAGLGMMLLGIAEASGADASSSKITSGHKKITNAFKFTVVSFSLVMIMLWVAPDMVTGDVDLSGFRLNTSKPAVSLTPAPVTPKPATTTPTGSASEVTIRERFAKAGIEINKSACGVGQTSNCTNVAGLPEETINMLLSLKSICGCSVVITGGTEPGHQTHGVGKRPVDLRIITDRNGEVSKDDKLYLFLKNNSTIFGPKKRSDGTLLCVQQYKWVGSNYIFCDEVGGDRHWHVN